MSEVRFVVTGVLERHALAESIGRLFTRTSVDFVVAPGEVHSFTSTPLTDPSPRVLDLVDKFADKLLREVDEHKEALVIGVDDLEFNDPQLTTNAVREAVERRLNYRWSSEKARDRARLRVGDRCSFHLMAPMPEAYFFGEPAALTRAEADKRPSLFDPATDVETFSVDDPEYLAHTEVTPAIEPNKERRKRSWAKSIEDRRHHPKLYVKFLCSPDDPLGDIYRERKHGVAAFRSLAWAQVASDPAHAMFARSLVSDIADYLMVDSPLPGDEHPLTSRSTPRHESLLRNM